MENQEPLTSPETTSSLGSRVTNVFASPSEAFQGLKDQEPKALHWVLPFSLFIVVAILFTYLIFTNEAIKSQIFDLQGRAFDEAVREGRMTQQQADQVRQQMEGTGLGMFMVFGSIPQIIFIAAYYFGAALFLWLTCKIAWKSTVKYGKYLEAYGLASWVGVLGYLVSMLMILGMNTLYATPSLGLMVMDDFDPMNTAHKFLSAANLFSIWQAAVTGIGVSKLTDKSLGSGIGVAVGLWVVWVAIGVPLGIVR